MINVKISIVGYHHITNTKTFDNGTTRTCHERVFKTITTYKHNKGQRTIKFTVTLSVLRKT